MYRVPVTPKAVAAIVFFLELDHFLTQPLRLAIKVGGLVYRTLCKLSYRLKFVLIGQNRTTNQRSGMILEVQIQFFDQNNNCVFIVLKAKTGKKLRTKIG